MQAQLRGSLERDQQPGVPHHDHLEEEIDELVRGPQVLDVRNPYSNVQDRAMSGISLTYVVNTRNKVPLLKEAMSRLIRNVQPDEEVVVVDGGSTDGTIEYLTELYQANKIHQFLSEPDRGEAHGWNKSLLMAQGELIKPITDDDAFYWPGIQTCKHFMLGHPQIDLLGSNGAGTNWNDLDPFVALGDIYTTRYKEWRNHRKPFAFSGLGIMIRRSSIPLLGLFHTGFIWVDMEFSLRATSGPANVAWYTGNIWVRITNPQSNSVTQNQRVNSEGRWLQQFYLKKIPKPPRRSSQTRMDHIKQYLRAIKRLVIRVMSLQNTNTSSQPNAANGYREHVNGDWPSTFMSCEQWLATQNNNQTGECLFRESETFPLPR